MTDPKRVPLEVSAVRALAALETASGKRRVEQYFASLAPPNGAPELSVDDLVTALQVLRRHV